jgi:hypothetical protein
LENKARYRVTRHQDPYGKGGAVRSKVFTALAAATLAGGLAAAVPASAKTLPGSSQARAATGTLVPAHPGELLPLKGGTVDSLNWSGYAVTGSGITGVDGSFVVPTAGLVPPGFAATWAGIGGYNTSDLIQAGVEEDSVGGYYAWYEMLPASETPLSGCTGDSACTVNPGDDVTVDIANTGGSNWTISLTDAGHWSWSKTVSYSSSESSAEWILEAPTLLVAQTTLANVGTVHFGPTSTYTQGGSSHTIAAGNPTQIDLGLGIVNEATPSALASNGESFNDCAYAQSCPAP